MLDILERYTNAHRYGDPKTWTDSQLGDAPGLLSSKSGDVFHLLRHGRKVYSKGRGEDQGSLHGKHRLVIGTLPRKRAWLLVREMSPFV